MATHTVDTQPDHERRTFTGRREMGAHVERILHVLIGNVAAVPDAIIKTAALFITAAVLLRLTERRTLAEFAPFDWIAAVAAGAIVGRAATATDTSWLSATAGMLSLLLTHALLARLRFIPRIRRFIDPPLKILIRDGQLDKRNLRRCGLTGDDLQAVLRQHGHRGPEGIHLAIFEAKGAISILCTDAEADRREFAAVPEDPSSSPVEPETLPPGRASWCD